MKCLPTPRFSSRSIQVPFFGKVSRPGAVTAFDVPDGAAQWLIDGGYVKPLEPVPVSQPEPKPEPVTEASSKPEISGDDELLIQFQTAIETFDADEIADAIKGVGITTAKRLKAESLDSWETIDELLSESQKKSAIAWVESLE